jgi:lipopolysaccharide/colanic/teichoic acid biosynthesis glycosyltransferase
MNESPGGAPNPTLWRVLELVCAAAGLLVLSPLFAAAALLIVLRDGRPALFSQVRVGRQGRRFRIWKFRTMRDGTPGCAVTAAGDSRITRTGAWMRKFKLDELPQLFNVVRGDMSLIGPRPERPEFVNGASPLWQAVLQVRPGITDPATLLFRDEERLLERADDVESFYREKVLPAKLLLNVQYLRTRSFVRDVQLIWLTILYSLSPERFDTDRIRKAFATEARYVGYLYSLSSTNDR